MTEQTETTEPIRRFLGIPVQGDIRPGEGRKEQWPLSRLAPFMQEVLDDPTIVAFGWSQYTPYFNDGEPCVFSVNELWVRTETDPDPAKTYGYDDLSVCSYLGHPSLGKVNGHQEGDWPNQEYVIDSYEGPDRARFERCFALGAALQGGHYDNVLLDAFGDHAEITVTREGITVDSCDHE